VTPWKETGWNLSVRKDRNHLKTDLPMPNDTSRHRRRIMWSILSKAALESRRSKDLSIIGCIRDCSGGIRLAFSSCPKIWSATMHSTTLEIKVKFEMGR